jgi:hypothetical protein
MPQLRIILATRAPHRCPATIAAYPEARFVSVFKTK